MTPSLQQMRTVLNKKSYAIFDSQPYDLNIVGIRSNISVSNSFDDLMTCFYKDQNGDRHFHIWPCTTDPGKPWLLNPLVKEGAAILCPGQYRAAYEIGYHHPSSPNRYKAFSQRANMTYVRDGNRDAIVNTELCRVPELRFDANLKTNIHRASPNAITRFVEKYSAGCQVFQNSKDFDDLLSLGYLQIKYGGPNMFTYTLLEEADFV